MFGRCLVKDERRRLVEAVVSTGAPAFEFGQVGRPVMDAAAADLSLVDAGNVPLLVDHERSIDGLVGRVEAAWFDAGDLRAVLRFGASAKAEAAWRAVLDDLPVRVSIGFRVIDIELPEEEGDPVRYTRWRLDDVSLTLFAKDPGACLAVADSPAMRAKFAGMIEAKRDLSHEQRREALFNQIGAEEWRAWATAIADELAEDLAVSYDAVWTALSYRVDDQLEEMVQRRYEGSA
jgi:hypothetical protein